MKIVFRIALYLAKKGLFLSTSNSSFTQENFTLIKINVKLSSEKADCREDVYGITQGLPC